MLNKCAQVSQVSQLWLIHESLQRARVDQEPNLNSSTKQSRSNLVLKSEKINIMSTS